MATVMRELVQIVSGISCLPEQGNEQLSTGREKDEEHCQ